MKPTIQKLPIPDSNSFKVQNCENNFSETSWHQHIENELILFTHGAGIAVLGDHKGRFQEGDIFFIGSSLPHSFQPDGKVAAIAVIIHFLETCWGNYFINLPECIEIRNLFELATYGLKVIDKSKHHLKPLIKDLEKITGINRIIYLLHCLQTMSSEKEYIQLSKKKATELNHNVSERIQKVIEFTLIAFNEQISTTQIAAIACMSIPSFCLHFKERTGKTYNEYLNEVRINHACRQLLNTGKGVNEIGYESGYNTIAHFHRQFFKLKSTTPLQYRIRFSVEIMQKYNRFTAQKNI